MLEAKGKRPELEAAGTAADNSSFMAGEDSSSLRPSTTGRGAERAARRRAPPGSDWVARQGSRAASVALAQVGQEARVGGQVGPVGI
jgi:hypothetical protein